MSAAPVITAEQEPTTVPVLSGWVDPEGDPFVLSDAYETDSSSPVMVVPMADGRVAIRHTDPNAADAVIAVTVVVEDVHGATAEKTLATVYDRIGFIRRR